MDDWATSARIKVERAKKHISDLEARIRAFKESSPYIVLSDQDPDTGDRVFRIRMRSGPPVWWGTIIGDAIHNLRSALDVLIYQHIFRVTGKRPSHLVEFPIFGSAHKFETRMLPKVQGASQAAVDLLKAIKPYKGGMDGLYALHRLDIIDKHHVLVPVCAAYRHVAINTSVMFRRMAETETDPTLLRLFNNTPDMFIQLSPSGPAAYPLKDGAELYRIGAKSVAARDVDMDPQFTFTIAFREGEPVEGQPVIPTLRQFTDLVEGIVAQFARLQ